MDVGDTSNIIFFLYKIMLYFVSLKKKIFLDKYKFHENCVLKFIKDSAIPNRGYYF